MMRIFNLRFDLEKTNIRRQAAYTYFYQHTIHRAIPDTPKTVELTHFLFIWNPFRSLVSPLFVTFQPEEVTEDEDG